MSIKTKLILAFFAVAFTPLLALGLILFQGVKSDIINTSKNDIVTIANSQKRAINEFSQHNLDVLRFISTMPNMGRVAEKISHGEDAESAKEEMQNIYETAMSSNKEFEALFLLHAESGEVISSSLPSMEGMFFNTRKYFHLGKKDTVLYPVHYSLSLEKNIMAIAAPINHKDALIGVLIAWVNIRELTNILTLPPPIKSYLVSRSNIHIIGNTQDKNALSVLSGIFSEGVNHALAGKTGSDVYINHEDNEVVGAYTFIDMLGTALITEIISENIVEGANRKAQKVLIITLILAFLVLLISVALGNQIANPILTLTGRIKRFGDTGSDDVLDPPEGGTEVLELAASFNEMLAQRKEIELALIESEEKARAISDASMDSIIMINGEGIITYLNKATEHILGYKEEELLGIKLHEMIVSNDARHQYYDKLPAFGESGKCHVVGKILELLVTKKDGIRIPVEVSIASVMIRGEWFSVGIMRDIGARKKAEKLLMESEKKYRDLFEKAFDPICIVDEKGNYIDVNQRAIDLFGYSRDEFLAMNIRDVIPKEQRPESDKVFEELKNKGTYENFIGKIRTKDNKWIDIEVNSSAIIKNGVIIGSRDIVRDITERKKNEEERDVLFVKLHKKNKELEQVLYVTSHDLRSPLVNVEGFSRELDISLKELLAALKSMDIPQDVQDKIRPVVELDIPESLKYIHGSIEKMNALLAGLLKLSRIGRLELNKTQLDMNKLMTEIIETFEFRLKESGIKLHMSDLFSCIGDENLLNQVFSNIIDNAIKYLDPERPGIIRISGYVDGKQSIYCVEDNGIGIASDHQDKIFEIFYQLEPEEGKGEGLGLATIYKILDMHDGKIWVESEYGKGSKFFVSLPA